MKLSRRKLVKNSFIALILAMVVIGGTSLAGGKGRLWGTVVGILLMVCLSSGLDMLGVSAYYQMMVKGFVVILAVMLDGLSSD